MDKQTDERRGLKHPSHFVGRGLNKYMLGNRNYELLWQVYPTAVVIHQPLHITVNCDRMK